MGATVAVGLGAVGRGVGDELRLATGFSVGVASWLTGAPWHANSG